LKTIKKRSNVGLKRPFDSSGGSPSAAEVERRLRIHSLLPSMTPISLEYEPLESTGNMKRLLADLTNWVLEKRIHHRQASACRALIHEYIAVEEFEKLPDLERRLKALEEAKQT